MSLGSNIGAESASREILAVLEKEQARMKILLFQQTSTEAKEAVKDAMENVKRIEDKVRDIIAAAETGWY